MKFTKGYWMNLPGVTNTDAVQVREVKVENDRVYLYTVPYHADMRAMGGPLLGNVHFLLRSRISSARKRTTFMAQPENAASS